MFALFVAIAAGVSTASSSDVPIAKPIPRKVAQQPMAARVKPVVAAAVKHVTAPSAYAQEAAMSGSQLVARWNPLIDQAARRFGVPSMWIRAVIMVESGGRTMLGEKISMTSSAGAMGLMQVMPQTWREMRRVYRLGADPYNPHDNILAGTAYLDLLYHQYGYPGLFAAYNDGPGMLEAHRRMGQLMPAETTSYVLDIASILSTGVRRNPRLASGVPGPEPIGSAIQGAVSAVILVPAAAPRQPRASDDGDDDGEH